MPDASSVVQNLVNLGLSPLGAAAMASRAGVESSYNPNVYGDHGTSYGLWQWHGPRMASLMSFAQGQGLDPSSPETQARFLVHELGTSEKGAGDVLKSAATPEQAAAGAMMFERPQGYTAQNPMGGLGAARTLADTRALVGGGMATGGAPPGGSTASAASPPQPQPDDTPIQPIAPTPQPQQQAAAPSPAPNLGMLGQSDPGQQAQQAAAMLAQFLQQNNPAAAAQPPMGAPMTPGIPSILRRTA